MHCIFAEVGVLSKEEALLGFFTIFIIISIIIVHIFDFLFIFNHILCVSVLLDLAKPNLVRNRNKYNNINKPTNYIHIFLINLCLFLLITTMNTPTTCVLNSSNIWLHWQHSIGKYYKLSVKLTLSEFLYWPVVDG